MVVISLREVGYIVLEAANAGEAVQHAEREGRIDMLVTDVVMPGESGVTLAEEFRRHRPEARVLYVSGYGARELARRGVEDDGANILTKPFSHDELLIAVRVALDAGKRTPTDA